MPGLKWQHRIIKEVPLYGGYKPEGAVGVWMSGSAPGTIGNRSVASYQLGTAHHAVVLSGGSAFGLAAANGVMRYLEEQGMAMIQAWQKYPL